jgi:GNAT superfamily N-acetyltransferase
MMRAGDTEAAKEPNGEAIAIGRLERGQIKEAARLFARGFADERFFSYLLRGRSRPARERALVPMFRVMIRSFLPLGHIHTASLDGRLVGAGIRVPPGGYPMRGLKQVRFMLSMMPAFVKMLARAPSSRELLKVLKEFERLHPKEPHWYLMWVAVEPELHGRGIGGRLAQEVISLADAQGMPCYLETFGVGTKALYQHRGFAVRQEIHPLPEGPDGWTMWRDPQRTAEAAG